MALLETTPLGRNQRFYAIAEASYGAQTKATSASAMRVQGSNMDQQVEDTDVHDSSQTGSTLDSIQGRKATSWSVEAYAYPGGAAGDSPACHALLRNWFGVQTISAGVSVVYTITESQSARASLSLTREYNGIFSQICIGATTEQIKVAYSGTSVPMISFDGTAKDLVHTGYAVLEDLISASTTAVVTAATSANISSGSIIQIGAEDGTNGLLVSGKTNAADVSFVLDEAISADDASAVIPFVPTPTYLTTTPVSHINCTLTIDGTTTFVTQFEITAKNNSKPHDDQAGEDTPHDVSYARRDIQGSVTIRANRDQLVHLGKFHNAHQTARAFVITCGSTAGNRFVLSVPYAQIRNAKFEHNEDDCMITLPFFAKGSGAGANEFSMSWT